MTRWSRTVFAVFGALLGVAVASSAAAADGSVPSEVSAYVTDGSLVERLADVYGPDQAGNGVAFDETTKTGTIVRVHVWTDAQLAGEPTDHPIELINEWIVPIAVGGEPVGLATIGIDAATTEPELTDFDADPEIAIALSAVPDGSALIRDDGAGAWLALADDDTVTPLVPGTSGLSTPVPLDDVAIIPPDDTANVVPEESTTGLGLAAVIVVMLIAVIVLAVLAPLQQRRKARTKDPAGE
jgi:hypothetical protein